MGIIKVNNGEGIVKLNTIYWENEADFAPEFLYELAQHQEQQAMPAVQLQQAA